MTRFLFLMVVWICLLSCVLCEEERELMVVIEHQPLHDFTAINGSIVYQSNHTYKHPFWAGSVCNTTDDKNGETETRQCKFFRPRTFIRTLPNGEQIKIVTRHVQYRGQPKPKYVPPPMDKTIMILLHTHRPDKQEDGTLLCKQKERAQSYNLICWPANVKQGLVTDFCFCVENFSLKSYMQQPRFAKQNKFSLASNESLLQKPRFAKYENGTLLRKQNKLSLASKGSLLQKPRFPGCEDGTLRDWMVSEECLHQKLRFATLQYM